MSARGFEPLTPLTIVRVRGHDFNPNRERLPLRHTDMLLVVAIACPTAGFQGSVDADADAGTNAPDTRASVSI